MGRFDKKTVLVSDSAQAIGATFIDADPTDKASDDTRYVTAQVVYADGGAFLSTPVVEAVWDL